MKNNWQLSEYLLSYFIFRRLYSPSWVRPYSRLGYYLPIKVLSAENKDGGLDHDGWGTFKKWDLGKGSLDHRKFTFKNGVHHLTHMEWLSMTGYVMMRVYCHKSRPPHALAFLCTVLSLSDSTLCAAVPDTNTILSCLNFPHLPFILLPALNTVCSYNNTKQTKTGTNHRCKING